METQKQKKSKKGEGALSVIGVTALLSMKHKPIGFTDKWLKSYGDVDEGFLAIFFGDSGNGKTEAAMQLAKYLCNFDRVLYLSYEQQLRSTIQKAFRRNNMEENKGKMLLSPGGTFEAVCEYLRKKASPRYVFFDSVDYCKFTFEQVQLLRAMFPKKSFIFISHATGSVPKLQLAKDIRYDADIKIRVKKYVAFPDSRFEGGDPFIVWEEKARQHHPLLFEPVEGQQKKKRGRKPKTQ